MGVFHQIKLKLGISDYASSQKYLWISNESRGFYENENSTLYSFHSCRYKRVFCCFCFVFSISLLVCVCYSFMHYYYDRFTRGSCDPNENKIHLFRHSDSNLKTKLLLTAHGVLLYCGEPKHFRLNWIFDWMHIFSCFSNIYYSNVCVSIWRRKWNQRTTHCRQWTSLKHKCRMYDVLRLIYDGHLQFCFCIEKENMMNILLERGINSQNIFYCCFVSASPRCEFNTHRVRTTKHRIERKMIRRVQPSGDLICCLFCVRCIESKYIFHWVFDRN